MSPISRSTKVADDIAHVDAADVPDVGNRAGGADPAKGPDGRADVADIPAVNVAASAKVELNDDLQNVINRLQVYWGEGPAR